jgi:flagellar biosynthesis protein FliP
MILFRSQKHPQSTASPGRFHCLWGGACAGWPRYRRSRPVAIVVLAVLLFMLLVPARTSVAETATGETPFFKVSLEKSQESGDMNVILQIFVLMTVLSLAPSILIMLTSFTRIAIVFSLLRQAIGTQQLPPNQVLVGLALFLTFFIMTPVWNSVNQDALQPYLKKEISQQQALEKALKPIRRFMIGQTREKDLALLVDVAKLGQPKNIDDVPTSVLIPSFIISELKTAFQIGFMLYVPFLIIDMVVASVLLSMGMMMLPPIMVSLPFKLMIFVLADGWYLVVGSLIKSFSG